LINSKFQIIRCSFQIFWNTFTILQTSPIIVLRIRNSLISSTS
jgi:hypothetical protein